MTLILIISGMCLWLTRGYIWRSFLLFQACVYICDTYSYYFRHVFIFDTWLSVDDEYGSIECIVPVTSKADMKRFSFLFTENVRENTTESYLWLSVAIRPDQSNFTRVQRLECCLVLLFLTMITNAMFYGQDTGKKITMGPLKMSLSSFYISFLSTFIATIPVLLITYLFRNSRHRHNNSPQYVDNREITDRSSMTMNESQLPLPFWCRFIAWGFSTAAVLVSGFFLILYSMEWRKTKSEEWLLAFVLSFFEAMLIIDPVKVHLWFYIAMFVPQFNK